jgi:peptidoglycan LD-endopeptidase CwlK
MGAALNWLKRIIAMIFPHPYPPDVPRQEYGEVSTKNLLECDPSLQRVAYRALDIAVSLGMDLSVTEGHRGKEKQDAAVARGDSQTPWPTSKHNSTPSHAIHIQLYPVAWPQERQPRRTYTKLTGRFYLCAAIVLIAADQVGVKVRWGGDWDQDGDIMDQLFDDLCHFELV